MTTLILIGVIVGVVFVLSIKRKAAPKLTKWSPQERMWDKEENR